MQEFQIAFGTVSGTSHTNNMKNNQDAYALHVAKDLAIGVIADGCSAGAHSEVGAQLGAHIVTERLVAYAARINTSTKNPEFAAAFPYWEAVRQDTLAQLRLVATSMGQSLSKTVNDYFLFTLTGFMIAPFGTYIFSIGDGVYALNDDVTIVGPFPNNEPPYLGYGLVGSSIDNTLLTFDVPVQIPTSSVQSLAVGCDGVSDLISIANINLPGKNITVGDVSQFWMDDIYYKNPSALCRRLRIINPIRKPGGLLPDDTTLIVVRRTPTDKPN